MAATIYLNLTEEEKAQVNFLCDVHNKVLNEGTHKPKVTQTSILRDALTDYFAKNAEYLQKFQELGDVDGVAAIKKELKKSKTAEKITAKAKATRRKKAQAVETEPAAQKSTNKPSEGGKVNNSPKFQGEQ